jgi:hypothetical protein
MVLSCDDHRPPTSKGVATAPIDPRPGYGRQVGREWTGVVVGSERDLGGAEMIDECRDGFVGISLQYGVEQSPVLGGYVSLVVQ